MNNAGWDYRISLTEAGLTTGSLTLYHIVAPNKAPFRDSAVSRGRSDGGQALHGALSMEALWDRTTMAQAWRLRKFIDDAKAGTGLLYMTIDKNNASGMRPQWIDVSGRPHVPERVNDDGDIAGRMRVGQQFVDNFVLFLNNISILNDPSVYTVE